MTAQPCSPCTLPNACKQYGSCFREAVVTGAVKASIQTDRSEGFDENADAAEAELEALIHEIARLTEDNRLIKQEMDTKNMAAAAALDKIRKLIGAPDWDYPGQVVRDVEGILKKWICGNCDKVFDEQDAYRRHIGQQVCEESE